MAAAAAAAAEEPSEANKKEAFTPGDFKTALAVLHLLAREANTEKQKEEEGKWKDPTHVQIEKAAVKLVARVKRRKRVKEVEHDRKTLESRGIRVSRRVRRRLSASIPLPDGKTNLPIATESKEEKAEEKAEDPHPPPSSSSSSASAPSEHLKRRPRKCYICKKPYREMHSFYDKLCPECAKINYEKRHQTADMAGTICLVTGARIKIGYETALKLLRSGAHVIATSRFVKDAALRFSREQDFDRWRGRLHIYGIDFRNPLAVRNFGRHISTAYSRLDVLIHNACQTIRRPPLFYSREMMYEELPLPPNLVCLLPDAPDFHKPKPLAIESDKVGQGAEIVTSSSSSSSSSAFGGRSATTSLLLSSAAKLSQAVLLPEDEAGFYPLEAFSEKRDEHGQPVDLRAQTTWDLRLGSISLEEVCETQAVNTIAPFILTQEVLPLMRRKPAERNAHIINVSSMEGKFNRPKTTGHPHTNMAKAGLNMFTHTTSKQLAVDRIWMVSVDTGWQTGFHERTDGEPTFHPPLDEVDGASRILDPVFTAPAAPEVCPHGIFLKDFRDTGW